MNRQDPPEIHAIKALHTDFPKPANRLYRIDAGEGVFKLEIVFPEAGYGVSGDKFSAIFAMDLLLSGTSTRRARQIADAIDEMGGFVFKSCDFYSSSVTLYGLNENLSSMLGIVRNCIDDCVYDEQELRVFKNKKISELNINLNKTDFLANRRMNQLLFGPSHPYSEISTEEKINAVHPEKLIDYRKQKLRSPLFIYTGPGETEVEAILEKHGFDNKGSIYVSSKDEVMPERQVLDGFVEKKGSTQNSVRFGKIMPPREHPDYFKISLLNLILGGYFGSRLMKNIREEKGLTYGIHSSLIPFKSYTVFRISSECNKQLSEQVKTEIEKEILLLQTENIDAEELLTAKNYLLGAMLRNFDGAFNISERLRSSIELNTPDDYYQAYFRAIHEITAEELKTTANNYFATESLEYCVAGEL